jgi:magnesium transporter
MNFQTCFGPRIFIIALGVAHWVMRSGNSDELTPSVKPARRGMAQDIVASSADTSVLDRLPMREEGGEIRHEFVEAIARAIQAADAPLLRAVVGELHEADLGDLIAALEPDDRVRLVELMGADFDFSALNEVDDSVREEILEELEPATVAEGVRELESDDAVELLEGLDEDEQEEILERLSPSERDALERSLDYPENSAGRRMQTEFIAVPQGWTAGQAIDYMHDTPDLPDRFYEIYAVDGGQHWQGAVSLDALLRARRTVPLTKLIDEDRRRVSVNDDQEEVARLFGKYNLVAAPVVDTENRLVGVITVDDVVDVIEEEAEEDLKALGGVTRHEELSDNVWSVAKGRFNWLLVNLATAFLASSVLGLFEGQLEKMVALAVLAPIVASQGGNAATQTMTVAVRALATRELGSNNALRVVLREGLVGLVNGLAFAIITGVAAVLWFKIPGLGVVIGLAIICNLVAGALGGILVPMVLERVRADPAVASGTFVTTITDVVGFFSFLGIATLWFGLK